MGAQQILRVAAGLIVPVVVATWSTAAWAQGAPQTGTQSATTTSDKTEPVVVVDLRPGVADARQASRQGFLDALGHVTGIELPADPTLARALADEPEPQLQVTAASRRWDHARATVRSWRSGAASANALAIADLLTEVGVRFAILLWEGDRAEVWTLPPLARAARRVTSGIMRAPIPLAAALRDAATRLNGQDPDADVQILTQPSKKKETKKRQKWWVYASIIGAVAVGASIILAGDLASDRQRIELSYP